MKSKKHSQHTLCSFKQQTAVRQQVCKVVPIYYKFNITDFKSLSSDCVSQCSPQHGRYRLKHAEIDDYVLIGTCIYQERCTNLKIPTPVHKNFILQGK